MLISKRKFVSYINDLLNNLKDGSGFKPVLLQSGRVDEGLSAVAAHVRLDALVRPDVPVQVALQLEGLKQFFNSK